MLQYPNNTNQIMQADQYGTQQNLAYYDADNGFVIGGSDVRLSNLMSVPLNLFRQHHHFRFAQVSALDPRLAQTTTGGGSILLSANRLYLRTGTAAAGTASIARQQHYRSDHRRAAGLLLPRMPGGEQLRAGIRPQRSQRQRRVRQIHAHRCGQRGEHLCKVANGGAVSSVDTAQAVGTTRRLYCIEIVSPTVIKMYVSTTMGVLQLYATFTSPPDAIPASTCYPFIKLVSSGAAGTARRCWSQFYFVLIE